MGRGGSACPGVGPSHLAARPPVRGSTRSDCPPAAYSGPRDARKQGRSPALIDGRRGPLRRHGLRREIRQGAHVRAQARAEFASLVVQRPPRAAAGVKDGSHDLVPHPAAPARGARRKYYLRFQAWANSGPRARGQAQSPARRGDLSLQRPPRAAAGVLQRRRTTRQTRGAHAEASGIAVLSSRIARAGQGRLVSLLSLLSFRCAPARR